MTFYDVVVVDAGRKVIAVVGELMHMSDGYHSAIQRLNTWDIRVAVGYSVKIVETGKFSKGDILPKD